MVYAPRKSDHKVTRHHVSCIRKQGIEDHLRTVFKGSPTFLSTTLVVHTIYKQSSSSDFPTLKFTTKCKMAIVEVFSEAAESVKQLPSASNEDQLELYSLFKQSNLGDCATGMFIKLMKEILDLPHCYP